MVKRRCCLTLDGELVDLHRLKSPVPLSTDVNNYLRESLLTADELEEVEEEIARLENKLAILRPKLARLEQLKINEIANANNYATAYDTLARMQERNGCIGKNQLRLLAENRNMYYEGLLDYAEREGFKIVDFVNFETRIGKGRYVGAVNGYTGE